MSMFNNHDEYDHGHDDDVNVQQYQGEQLPCSTF